MTEYVFPKLSREETVTGLNRLLEHGFIERWYRVGSDWFVVAGSTWGPYTLREMAAWVEGANAMGAAP